MKQAGLKKLFVLGAFVIIGVIILYLFTLFGGKEKPAGESGQVQIVQTAGVSEAGQQAQAVDESAKFYPPDEVLASLCSKYSSLPDGVVPCREAYDFVIKNYKASIASFSLLTEGANGRKKPFAAGQPVAEGARLLWYAVLEPGPAFKPIGANASPPSYKGVFLDAKDLSAVKEAS